MDGLTKTEKLWLEQIQTCRESGLSDNAWCIANGISPSTFYYHVKKLRSKACEFSPAAALEQNTPTPKQEVVELHIQDEPPIEFPAPVSKGMAASEPAPSLLPGQPAIRMNFNGIQLEIANGADASLITNILRSLRQLSC